jgi:ketosteroid isomerase-like protein
MNEKLAVKQIFTSPDAVAGAFYEAVEARDVEAMMAVWADDEDIVCVHPGGPRLVGFESVRASWEHLFGGGQRLRFHLEAPVVFETVGMAVQTVIEYIVIDDEPRPRGVAIATNVFLRTPTGWRMVMHHSSSMPSAPPGGEPGGRQLH